MKVAPSDLTAHGRILVNTRIVAVKGTSFRSISIFLKYYSAIYFFECSESETKTRNGNVEGNKQANKSFF